ncbi:MAG: immunity protein Imm33 domain-containing protein [Armatimonadota bacterium]
METIEQLQRRICQQYGAEFTPPQPGSRLGIALQTVQRIPIQGIRYLPCHGTCGWYIYGGEEWSDDPDFYQALCVEHLEDYCKLALPFICLPPGWGFVTDDKGYIDVWSDENLLRE